MTTRIRSAAWRMIRRRRNERLFIVMGKKVILFVDNEQDALDSFKGAMEDRGYEVRTALTGAAGLDLIRQSLPDAVISDIRMQPMNGFVFFQEVKKIPGAEKFPFIFLTAIDDAVSQKYGKSLGVDSYIMKPVNCDHIDLILKRILKPT